MASIRRIMPLPLFFLGNAVCSLGGGKSVSIPQFSALRKFSVLFTMMLEAFLLKKPQSRGCVLSVMVMILGTFIAAFKVPPAQPVSTLCTPANGHACFFFRSTPPPPSVPLRPSLDTLRPLLLALQVPTNCVPKC